MIFRQIQTLIDYAKRHQLIAPEDEYVIRNQLMEALHLTDWVETPGDAAEDIDDILKPLIAYACEQEVIPDTAASHDLFDTKLMGILTPMPREVNTCFRQLYQNSPVAATDWYYDFSRKLNYVRAGRIAKDLKWTYASPYGTLDITINRSKPEKDPRDIAAARLAKTSAYPKCQLCPENAGFAGNPNHPARQNLRPIPMDIQGERWQMQYSPYGYYNEHCIVFNEKHIPMNIDRGVFEKLFDFLEVLPHYFIGSNADLPIVGGSILSHEHFQGGNYTFAMAKAPVEAPFTMADYPQVQAGIVAWPMSVIRVASTDRTALVDCCTHILNCWKSYSDEAVGVYAETNGTPHNTITPIARKKGDLFECDLVLRNNRTSEERPLGIFHPNPTLHHIKKENIGLIEVMGLAVLPARLAEEMDLLEKAMLLGENLYESEKLKSHAPWAEQVLNHHPDFSATTARGILEQEIGNVFEQVLEDAGVFKRTEEGQAGFTRFVQGL